MPTYEYKCVDCGKIFEVRQRFSDEPLKTHEECGGVVNRLLSVPALQFKGTGWYVTDYAKSGSLPPGKKGEDGKSEGKPESKSEGSSDSKSESGSSSKSEGKSESKSESKSSESSSTSSTPTPAAAGSDKK